MGGVGKCCRLVAVNWNDFKQLHKGTFSCYALNAASTLKNYPEVGDTERIPNGADFQGQFQKENLAHT